MIGELSSTIPHQAAACGASPHSFGRTENMTKMGGTEGYGDASFAAILSRRALLQAVTATVLAAAGPARVRQARAGPAITPFTYRAPQSALDDLRQRLAHTRWPERETVSDWSQGVPLAKLRSLVEYWWTD